MRKALMPLKRLALNDRPCRGMQFQSARRSVDLVWFGLAITSSIQVVAAAFSAGDRILLL